MALTTAFIFAPDGQPLPAPVRGWLDAQQFPGGDRAYRPKSCCPPRSRSRPRLVVIDARTHPVAALKGCQRLKCDSYTGIVPVCVCTRNDDASFTAAFDAGADEVLREDDVRDRRVAAARRDAAPLGPRHARASVHAPAGHDGDRGEHHCIDSRRASCSRCATRTSTTSRNTTTGTAITTATASSGSSSRILHDVVKGTCADAAFVGHIGGDDFLFVMPVDQVQDTCAEIVATFDALIPFQYSEQDRRAGYYFGKDRRGALHKVPMMTVSIGVVTNERRKFTHAAQVSELATEMKSYAKTLPGSVFTIDRRGDTSDEEPLRDRCRSMRRPWWRSSERHMS